MSYWRADKKTLYPAVVHVDYTALRFQCRLSQ